VGNTRSVIQYHSFRILAFPVNIGNVVKICIASLAVYLLLSNLQLQSDFYTGIVKGCVALLLLGPVILLLDVDLRQQFTKLIRR